MTSTAPQMDKRQDSQTPLAQEPRPTALAPIQSTPPKSESPHFPTENVDTTTTPVADAKQLFENFKFMREEVRFQANQVNARVGAYVASQAFLVTGLAASFKILPPSTQSNFEEVPLLYLLPVLGASISILMIPAILAARKRVYDQRAKLSEPRYHALYNTLIPQGGREAANRWGMVYAIAIPFVFLGFWTVAFLVLR